MLGRLIFVFSVITLVISAPRPDSNAKIIEYNFEPNTGDGSYTFKLIQTDGTKREESGRLKKGKDNEDILEIKGYYKYYNDEGEAVVNYIADENGYREYKDKKISDDGERRFDEVLHFPAAALGSLIGGGLGK